MKKVFGIISIVFLYGLWCADLGAVETKKIDHLEFEGVSELNQQQLVRLLEVDVGDVFSIPRVQQTIRNIELDYKNRGFQNATVAYEFVDENVEGKKTAVLRFKVREGSPTRIGQFEFYPEGLNNPRAHSFWNEIEDSLLSEIELKPGDVYDRTRLSDISKEIEEFLVQDEFVGAKLKEVRVGRFELGEDARHAVTQEKYDELSPKTSGWIKLGFYIDLGERISFGFRGNQLISRGELKNIVEEQRAIGFAVDYVESIRNRIVDLYHSKGFRDVVVTVYTYENPAEQKRHISYSIIENVRVRLGKVQFDGNFVFNQEELRKVFFEQASLLLQNGYFVENDIEAAAELTVDWIKSKGYLSAKLITIKTTRKNTDPPEVGVLVYLYEGEQTIVRDIVLNGITHFEPGEVKETLKLKEKEPLDLFSFNEGIEFLKEKYRNKGYLDVRILNENERNVVTYDKNNRYADIRLDVQEGPQYKVNQIIVAGLTKTKEYIVRRELTFKVEKILEEKKLAESATNLRKLGIFANVKIQHRNTARKPGYKDIRVNVAEGTPGFVTGGLGIRNDLGVRVFGSLGYTNLWNRNHTWLLSGNANRRFEQFCRADATEDPCFAEYQIRIAYVWPWFLIDEMTFRPELRREKRRYDLFDAETTGLSLNFDKQLLRNVNLRGFFSYSLERTRQFNSGNTTDDQTLTIGSITPGLRLDLRDDPLAPRSGFFAIASIEIASTSFGSQKEPFPVGYWKAQFRADQIFPLWGRTIFYLSFRTGYARNTVAPSSVAQSLRDFVGIPIIKQFALGGAASLRGFQLQSVNQQDAQVQGSLTFVNYRSQIDFPIAGALTTGPFLDAGSVLVDEYSLGKDLRFGAGFGLRYRTPVGPVNFDWGFNLNPQQGEDPNVFHFSVGIL